ncbi:aldolase [Terfezia boudieri ATCC MYA-4762]|uniref:Aldolase n=1 Tax=Terfezia boudieri ATCC MYA-4762 TaxID=1051890 RepID=A0A3N4MAL1_9PEZI|nr:aldolase [Terfezia boudieri ATCC MYA-4762]
MACPLPPGIYVPVPTFFSPSIPTSKPSLRLPGLNLPLQSKHTLHLARSGIRGLVLAGSTGEAVHLTRSERKSLISSTRQTLAEAGFEGYPIIAGVAVDSVEDAVGQLVEAQEAGAQWGMVLVPSYFAAAGRNGNYQKGLVEWFTRVADASPIPILIYNYPSVTNNVSVSISTYVTLASNKNIVGCKLSYGDVSVHIQLASLGPTHNFHVFSGLGQQLFPILCGGCHGAIDGLAGIFPKSIVHLFNAAWDFVYKEEEEEEEGGVKVVVERKARLEYVRNLQLLVSRAEAFLEAEGTIGIKHAVGKEIFGGQGVEDGEFEGRPPLQGGLSDVEYAPWSEGVFVDMRKLEATF